MNTDKDGLGFPLGNTDKNIFRPKGSEYAVVPFASSLDLDNIAFTLEAWYRPHGLTGDIQAIVDSSTSYSLVMANSRQVSFGIYRGGANSVDSGASNTLSDDVWYHLTAVYDYADSLMRLYIDADQKATTSLALGGNNMGGNAWAVGAYWISAGSKGRYCLGDIDEVRIYNRAMSPAEVTKNYKHGKGKHK